MFRISCEREWEIRCDWFKWQKATRVLYNKNKDSLKVRRKFYKTHVRSTKMYRSECCAQNKKKETKTEVTEINMHE